MSVSPFRFQETFETWLPGTLLTALIFLFLDKHIGLNLELKDVLILVVISGFVIGPFLRVTLDRPLSLIFYSITKIINSIKKDFTQEASYLLWEVYPTISGMKRHLLKTFIPQKEVEYMERNMMLANTNIYNFIILLIYIITFPLDYFAGGWLFSLSQKVNIYIFSFIIILLVILTVYSYNTAHAWAYRYYSTTIHLYRKYAVQFILLQKITKITDNPIALGIINFLISGPKTEEEIKKSLIDQVNKCEKVYGICFSKKIASLSNGNLPSEWAKDISIDSVIQQMSDEDFLSIRTLGDKELYEVNIKKIGEILSES